MGSRSGKTVGQLVRPHAPVVAVDLYCGVGGLTRGLQKAGIRVVAGFDIDKGCRYAYEHNNKPATFHCKSITDVTEKELSDLYPKRSYRVLVGCAPCQPFSTYNQRCAVSGDPRWGLLAEFGRLVVGTAPDVVSMENVPGLAKQVVYEEFIEMLRANGYSVSENEVHCPDYGVPQRRTRLVVLASRLASIQLIPRTHSQGKYRNVSDALRRVPAIQAGETHSSDTLHRAAKLSEKNAKRIRASKPGGTWRDWPEELIAKCHKQKSGKTYAGVYGRMAWDEPSPTITTQFYGFGNGRFGHPDQDRGLSLREGAILQTFGKNYRFAEKAEDVHFKVIGRMIGNAVPVRLAEIIGRSIIRHVQQYES